MKTNTKSLAILLLVASVLVSCDSVKSKLKSFVAEETNETTAGVTAEKHHNVYILGSESSADEDETFKNTVYWKNGVMTALPDYREDSFAFYGTLISVDDGVVTIAGTMGDVEGGADCSRIAQWTNGNLAKLGIGRSYEAVMDMTKDGGSTYLLGHIDFDGDPTKAEIWVWKNGQNISKIKSQGDAYIFGRNIMVENNNIYVSGALTNNGKTAPVMWTNGIATNLECIEGKEGTAEEIIEEGDHIYIVGYMHKGFDDGTYDLVVWRDGKIYKKLLEGTNSISELKIVQDDDDIYVAATLEKDEKYSTRVWKNFKETAKSQDMDGFEMHDFDVEDGIVYMIGINSEWKATYLVNGKSVVVDGVKPNMRFTSIYVED